MKTPALTDTMKARLLRELQRDGDKEFDGEFVRTTDLERRLLDEYGHEAISLIRPPAEGARYHPLGHFPGECPWAPHNPRRVPEVIEAIFGPLAGRLPKLVALMQERCELIFAEQAGDEWSLHYLLSMKLHDGRAHFEIYTGGAPNVHATENESLARYGWQLPGDLQALYRVHDGFGRSWHNTVASSHELRVMAEYMDAIAEEAGAEPEGYRYGDLVEFFPDGCGNTQCFWRGSSGAEITVDWDHETWEISGEESFFAFVDRKLADLDES